MARLTFDVEDLLPTLLAALARPEVAERLRAPAPVDAPRFLTPNEFARRLTVSERTIRNWIAKGMPVARVGSVVRVPVAEADEWLLVGHVRNAAASTIRRLQLKRAAS